MRCGCFWSANTAEFSRLRKLLPNLPGGIQLWGVAWQEEEPEPAFGGGGKGYAGGITVWSLRFTTRDGTDSRRTSPGTVIHRIKTAGFPCRRLNLPRGAAGRSLCQSVRLAQVR